MLRGPQAAAPSRMNSAHYADGWHPLGGESERPFALLRGASLASTRGVLNDGTCEGELDQSLLRAALVQAAVAHAYRALPGLLQLWGCCPAFHGGGPAWSGQAYRPPACFTQQDGSSAQQALRSPLSSGCCNFCLHSLFFIYYLLYIFKFNSYRLVARPLKIIKN